MAHNTKHIQKISRESQNSKPHYLFCINPENQDEITMLVLSRTIPTLSKFNLQLISKLKYKSKPIHKLSKSLFQCVIPMKDSLYLKGNKTSKNSVIPQGLVPDCMHYQCNSKKSKTNSTLSLHASLNWAFIRIDMHDFFMNKYSVN